MANKVKSLLGGPGFYAVLALCVLAVGVGGYFLLFGEPAQTEAPTGPDTAASAPVEDLPEHEPVVETVPPEEPEEETEPVVMPEVTIPVDDTPVVAEEPHVVVLPIQGEVLTAFSVDQLLYNETLDDWRTHGRGGYRRGGRRCRPGRLRRDGLLHHRRSPDGHHRGDPAQRRL